MNIMEDFIRKAFVFGKRRLSCGQSSLIPKSKFLPAKIKIKNSTKTLSGIRAELSKGVNQMVQKFRNLTWLKKNDSLITHFTNNI